MKRRELEGAVQRLASEAGLRRVQGHLRPGKTWVGVCQGIAVVMNLDSVRLHLELTSPEQPRGSSDSDGPQVESPANEAEVALETSEDADFCRAARVGFPADWFEQNLVEPWGFQLAVDASRSRSLPPEALDGLLDKIAQDMHDLGAEKTLPCAECPRPATALGYFEQGFVTSATPYCTACWEALRQATQGQVRIGGATAAWKGWIFLAIAAVVFAGMWGVAQHPAWELPLPVLWLGSAAFGFGMAVATAWVAGGSTVGLRVGLGAALLAGTLGGNILGFQFLQAKHGVFIPWPQVVTVYFSSYLPTQLGQELLLIVGALIGGGIGMWVLRTGERMQVR